MADFLCMVPLLASLFAACGPPPPLATGYVEGDYVAVTPLATARIVDIPVRLGERVAKDAVLARIDAEELTVAPAPES